MNNCRNCGTDNLDSSRFCDECGTRLIAAVEALEIEPPLYAPPVITEAPASRPVSVTSIGVPPVNGPAVISDPSLESQGASNGSMRAKLVIERGDAPGTEFRLNGMESTIGRWDADNGIFPDVDLDVFDQEAKVSRRHARIKLQDGKYLIEDIGSTNGTYVNRGRRLLPGNVHLLKDGDEVIVGKTFMRFHVIV
ncbi:MAG: FHA domain-containing protein [Acidobacteriota bacterium]